MRQTKEIVGANVYNRAFNSSYIGGDGVSLINSAHPNVVGGTWSNTLAVPSDLSEAALEQAIVQISVFQNDRGLIISAVPDALVIPWNLEFEAHRILKSTDRVGGDLNDTNALKDLGKFRKGVVLNHFLTDPDAWFIRTNVMDGLKYFERRADEFSEDNDFDTENAKFKASGRYSFGWSDPRALFGSAGA
jgi:phage major head subunit gpT-like protein